MDLAAFGCATVMLAGNTIYTGAVFVPLAVVILTTTGEIDLSTRPSSAMDSGDINAVRLRVALQALSAPPELPAAWAAARVLRYVLLCTARVVATVGAAFVLKGALAVVMHAGDDEQHIAQLLDCKIYGAGPHCHDFFSLLYLCEGVFGYATAADLELATRLLLLPAVAVSFQWKNPDFLLKNPDFLLQNVDFIINTGCCSPNLRASAAVRM